MKIIKLIAYTIGVSLTITALAAVLDTVIQNKKQNYSAAVMSYGDGVGINELSDSTAKLSELIFGLTELTPQSIGKPIRAALDGVRDFSEAMTASVLDIICRS